MTGRRPEERGEMVHSMTAFGGAAGSAEGWSWEWDLRSVNGRGLDVKLRLPEVLAALEPDLRKAAGARLARGTLAATLRLSRAAAQSDGVDEAALAAHLARARAAQAVAEATGLVLAPMSVAEALALPGVVRAGNDSAESLLETLSAPVSTGFAQALDGLVAARAREGAALGAVLGALVDGIAQGCDRAIAMAPERAAHQGRVLRDAVARTTQAASTVDPDRIAQEVALIAVKGDVTEEIERLQIHVGSARALLAGGGAVGRKLDFLTQEFNREANTLCSKVQYAPLTQIGLDLKAAIDQMREQVQNVE